MAHIRKTNTKPARTRIIQIRVTEEEFEQISRKASDAGMSISAMGRKAILKSGYTEGCQSGNAS
jgi:predicted DNA binding CopG/RHH family protein